ncbi:TetR/AcrR family transcriptional regulator [Cupriavidus basilensis]|uniref:TetR/AcrR family transcriptional regulator n=1 Tax=Cupriavidus basilensis TaxID=68895 RepID=UPI0039F6FB67
MEGREARKPEVGARGMAREEAQELPIPEASKRERVLDAAERLFAEGGFDGVSMRDIAAAADVGLPLIVYHFETKRNLYRALFDRRKTLFEARLAALRQPLTAGEDSVEHIVRAFVEPVMRIQDTEAGIAYAKLVAREASDPREAERGIVADYFDPFAMEFVKAIRKALPGNARYAHWAYLFAVGALVMSVFDRRIERISGGKFKAGDVRHKSEYLVTFIAAGIRAGADRTSSRRSRESSL